MAKKNAWFIRLGQIEWSRHTYPRHDDNELTLLGSVRRGAQIGALAITNEGQYVQVVGDHIITLNNSKIRLALSKANAANPQRAVEPSFSAPRIASVASTVPVVVVKRRRVFVMPGK